MTIINISKPAEISCMYPSIDSNIHLFCQFFIHSDAKHCSEIKSCLKKNSENNYITHIHLLNEKIFSNSELGIESPKIIQSNIGTRLTFKDIIKYIRMNNLKGYFIFANSDILFDDTISNLLVSTIHEPILPKKMFALLRYEYCESDIEKSTLFGPRFDSQDTWIFHSNNFMSESQENVFNIKFGKPGCDNKIAYILNILGFEIINDPAFIKTYHFHTEIKRDYGANDIIHAPWSIIVPSCVDPKSNHTSLDVDMVKMAISTRDFTRIGFGDNHVLRNYISTKLENGKNFIIPRIAGVENNVIYVARLCKFHGRISKERFEYFRGVNSVMKNNAGIKLSNVESVMKYSELYLDAFENSEIFSAWDSGGNVHKYIEESHDGIVSIYGETRTVIWSYALDIYNYIYNSPWTTAFRGKRILIISSFAESISEKIPIREKIYGIDLFPECVITTILPPQTHGGNESREFDIELSDFCERLDAIRDTYDIALVSCGGYCNPVCNHIFKSGKSAIYVGGTIQMMFGILGNRWLQETPDIVRLYINSSWSRPKMNERPKGFENIEKGCYF